MDIRIFKTLADLNESFTLLLREIAARSKSTSIALSGGFTPKALFDYWAGLSEGIIDWRKIRFFWGDERCVPPEDTESNYRMTREHLFSGIEIPEGNIFRIRGEADPDREAERYAALLQQELELKTETESEVKVEPDRGVRAETESVTQEETELKSVLIAKSGWVLKAGTGSGLKAETGSGLKARTGLNPETEIWLKPERKAKQQRQQKWSLMPETGTPNEIPVFDLVMLGLGDDGHTASIFPDQIGLWDDPRVCVTAVHPVSGQRRVSLTGRVINAARNVAFLVTGANKAEKAGEIITRPIVSEKIYPAARVKPMSGNLFWFLDEEAARLLR